MDAFQVRCFPHPLTQHFSKGFIKNQVSFSLGRKNVGVFHVRDHFKAYLLTPKPYFLS